MRWMNAALVQSGGLDDEMAHCEHDLERPQRALVSAFPPVDAPTATVYDDEVVELIATLDTCPFAEEIHDNDRLCWCCVDCRHQCAMDI